HLGFMRNDCQHHETQMGIRLESWELDPKWVLYRYQYKSLRSRARKDNCFNWWKYNLRRRFPKNSIWKN
ncbi:MAG: hypothetical protein MJK14_11715, partial [Rivularia sp. ALOHA_DT_140]|nr:hypothetical protein [Rivularia sp. ALOHA_DT_140]